MKSSIVSLVALFVVLAGLIQQAKAGISESCMQCICKKEGCEEHIGECNDDMGSDACGPYQIHYRYWVDCGRPGAGWRECTKEMACSEKCVKAYMKRYGKYCTRGREPTCKDYARIHNGGPTSCRPQSDREKERNLRDYWAAVSRYGPC